MADRLKFLREQYAELGVFNYEFRVRQEEDWPKTLDYWFGSDRWRGAKSSLELIGVDGTGGMYCHWRYPNMPSSAPPVVFFGSEGEGVSVIAANVSALVEILAQGFIWLGDAGRFVKAEDNLVPQVLAEFRARVKSELGYDLRDPIKLHKEAMESHPDFKNWVDTLID